MTYQEQIKHPRWQKKRLEVMEANGFRCQTCGTEDQELHVHHSFYYDGAVIWDYKTDELQSLCSVCHKAWHDTHPLEVRERRYTGPSGDEQYHSSDHMPEGITPEEEVRRIDAYFEFCRRAFGDFEDPLEPF